MKKLLFTVFAIVALSLAAKAQFSKGTIMAGGSVGYSSTTNKETVGNVTTTLGTTSSLTFLPQVGYFFIDNLAAGAGITLQSVKFSVSGSNQSNSTTEFLFSPFARYYLPQKIYGQFGFDVGSGTEKKTNNNNATTETTSSISGWSLLAGYAIMLNDHVAVEPQVGYRSLVQDYGSNNGKLTDAGLFLRIGLQVYLRK